MSGFHQGSDRCGELCIRTDVGSQILEDAGTYVETGKVSDFERTNCGKSKAYASSNGPVDVFRTCDALVKKITDLAEDRDLYPVYQETWKFPFEKNG